MPSFSKLKTSILRRSHSPEPNSVDLSGDSPEALARHGVQAFCESDSADGQGEEVQHLPVVVEATESSPAAAAAAAYQICKYLSKENYDRPSLQYNAVMLLRLLCNHPGQPFTRNIDSKFVTTISHMLRSCKQQSVQQILRETLDILEIERSHDEDLKKLIQMWRMNKGQNARFNVPLQVAAMKPAATWPMEHNRAGSTSPKRLPPAAELATRVEEAKNSAKILVQLVQSTPLDELLISDLIKEFSERCQNAQSSFQRYMAYDNPPPDPDTLQTLIETSEQLSISLSKVQRAKLNARRTLGMTTGSASSTPPPETHHHPPPTSRDFAGKQPGIEHGMPHATRLAPAPSPTPPPFTVRVTEPKPDPQPDTEDPFADFNAELAPKPTIAHRPSNMPQHPERHTSAFASSPYTVHGANGPAAAAQPVYRY